MAYFTSTTPLFGDTSNGIVKTFEGLTVSRQDTFAILSELVEKYSRYTKKILLSSPMVFQTNKCGTTIKEVTSMKM